MEKYRVIEIKQSIFADNDKQADILREKLKEKGVFLLNLMSSPGAGSTKPTPTRNCFRCWNGTIDKRPLGAYNQNDTETV